MTQYNFGGGVGDDGPPGRVIAGAESFLVENWESRCAEVGFASSATTYLRRSNF